MCVCVWGGGGGGGGQREVGGPSLSFLRKEDQSEGRSFLAPLSCSRT